MLELYHCRGARSLRPLWTLEELGVSYSPILLPFPPRVHAPEFLDINPLGTIPFLVDGQVRMSESSAICLYLVSRYGPTELAIAPEDPEYAPFLDWLFFSDATLTFPQTIVLRYRRLEAAERRVEQVAEDYERWFRGRLKRVTAAVAEREWLCGGRFTIADVAIAYALHLAESVVGLGKILPSEVHKYLDRARARPAFKRALEVDRQAPEW